MVPIDSELQPYRFDLEHRAFIHTFADIVGPITTKDYIWVNTIGDKVTSSNHPVKTKYKKKKCESKRIEYEVKRFILTCTCSQTRMLNIEILDSKNTSDVLNGLKRFFARRNVPDIISTDVSTEFVRSSKEVDLLWKTIDKKVFYEFMLANKVDWRFSYPYSPQMNGLIERCHRPIKAAFETKFIQTPTYSELQTLLAQLESYQNMKPLGFIKTSSTDYEVVTPIELVTGIKQTFIPEYRCKQFYRIDDLVTSKDIAKRRKLLDISLTRAWRTWLVTYIHDQTTVRSSIGTKMRNPRINDVVLLNSL